MPLWLTLISLGQWGINRPIFNPKQPLGKRLGERENPAIYIRDAVYSPLEFGIAGRE